MRYVDIFELNRQLTQCKICLKHFINFCKLFKDKKNYKKPKEHIKFLETRIKELKIKIKEWNREYSYHYEMFLKLNSNLLLLNKKKYDSIDLRMFYNNTEQGKKDYNKEQYEFFKKD